MASWLHRASGGHEPPAPIDPRGPRVHQAVVAVLLAAGYVVDQRWIALVVAALVLVGVVFGPEYDPVEWLYARFIRPRLADSGDDEDDDTDDPRPHRFAAALAVFVLVAATVAFVVGAVAVGWALALLVAALGGLAAITHICVGCEAYRFLARGAGQPGSRR